MVEKKGSGRQKNFINKPDPKAEGHPHTRLKVNDKGEITNYATFNKNPKNPSGLDLTKRVDLQGKAHFDPKTGQYILTPHVHDKLIPSGIRPANKPEIPRYKK